MTSLNRQDRDLHHSDGSHRSTPSSTAGHMVTQHHNRLDAHMRRHRDGRIRRIASEWSAGIKSDSYAFVSTGTIRDTLKYETGQLLLNSDVNVHGQTAIDELTELHEYVLENGPRDRIPGWGKAWEDS